MVQPLTCILVGTKMEKLQTNTNKKQTQNKSNEQFARNKKQMTPAKEEQLKLRFKNAQCMLLKIEANRRNDTPRPRDEIDRVRCQAIIDKYLKLYKVHENKGASISKTNDKDLHSLTRGKPCVALVNDVHGYMKPVPESRWPQIEAEIRENAKILNKVVHFELAGIYKGFFVINYKHKASLLRLTRCVGKIRFLIRGVRLMLIPASQLPKILEKQSLGDPDIETSQSQSTPPLTNKPSIQQDQQEGTQLPVKYFAADQLSANMSDPIYRESMRANYIREKSFFQEMNNMSGLSKGQKRRLRRIKSQILKYEQFCGIPCDGTVCKPSKCQHIVTEKQAVNKDNDIKGKSFNGNNNFELRMQDKQKFQPNYLRAEVPSTSDNYRELEMERVPQPPSFNGNDNSRANSHITEFTSSSMSSWEESEMAPVNAYPSRTYCDSDEESYYKRRNEKFQPNYIRAEVPSTSGNYRELEMERVPQRPNFKRNDNSRANSHRTEFTSSGTSTLESEMAPVMEYPSRIYVDSSAENSYKRRNDQILESFSKRARADSAMRGDRLDFPSTSKRSLDTSPSKQYSRAENHHETDNLASKSYISESIFFERRQSVYNRELSQTNTANKFCKTEFLSISSERWPDCTEILETKSDLNLIKNKDDLSTFRKAALEERILECLDSCTDDVATPKTATEPNESIMLLKHKLEILRKRNADQAANDAIVLSSDSDVEELNPVDEKKVIDIDDMTPFERRKIRKEYYNAIKYLKEMRSCSFKLLTQAEKHQIEICQQKVKKYPGVFRKTKTESQPEPTADANMPTNWHKRRQSSCDYSVNTLPTSSHSTTSEQQEKSGFWKSGNNHSYPNNPSPPVKSSSSIKTLPSSSHASVRDQQELNKQKSGYWKCGNNYSFQNDSKPVKSFATELESLSNNAPSNSSIKTLTGSGHAASTKQQQELNKQQSGFWKCGNNQLFPNDLQRVESFSTQFKNLSNNPQSSSGGFPNVRQQAAFKDATQCDEAALARLNSDLQIAIIDRNQEDGKISKEAWLKIEKDLLVQLAKEMEETNNTNIGRFNGTYWGSGIKIIQCENRESLHFIRRFINNQHISWPNARYEVIRVSELPKRSVVKVFIPPPIMMEDTAVLKIIKAQNSMFNSLDWTLVDSKNNGKGRDLYISISRSSLQSLRNKNGIIRYGINHINMILPLD